MKTLKLMVITAFLFISCDNENQDYVDQSDKSMVKEIEFERLFYKITSYDDTDEQMLIASALTPEEMVGLWKIKIVDFKENNPINENQMSFLNKLEKTLNEELFKDSEYRNNFSFQNLLVEAQTLFGVNEGEYFLSKVENINQRIAKIKSSSLYRVDPSETIESCNCTKSSNCKRITSIGLDGVGWEYGTCSGSTCYRETYLFGLIESSNNKKCVY